MSYVLADLYPSTCGKFGPFASSSEASVTSCPTGTTFHSYEAAGDQTMKICCPQPASLTPVAALNTTNAPATPLDCPRGTYFVQSGNSFQCVYCSPQPGGAPCPGVPGIGYYKTQVPFVPKPTAPVSPYVTTPVTLPPLLATVPVTTHTVSLNLDWLSNNWPWLAAIAVTGGGVYWWTRRKSATA